MSGQVRPLKVDVRVIAATHKDLKEEIKRGKFREDLFYRIHAFPIPLPPLSERTGDIPLLVDHFLKKYSQRLGKTCRIGSECAGAAGTLSLSGERAGNWKMKSCGP